MGCSYGSDRLSPPPVILWEWVLHESGSRPSHGITVMLGNDSQCHIYACRDPRRRDQVTFLHDVLIINHIDSREQSSHLLQDPPMRRGSLAIQQTGFA